MASISICPSCGKSSFEFVETPVLNTNFQFYFIRCYFCGCVVGTHENHNITEHINKLAEKLNITLD